MMLGRGDGPADACAWNPKQQLVATTRQTMMQCVERKGWFVGDTFYSPEDGRIDLLKYIYRGILWVAGLYRRIGAVPMPFRRTFASVILTFTHSTGTSLRHPGSVQFPTPLNWHGQRPSPTMFPKEP